MCDKTFKNPRSLSEHKRSHTDKKLFSCSFCSKTFKGKRSLISHYDKNHKAPEGVKFGPHVASFAEDVIQDKRRKDAVEGKGNIECNLCKAKFTHRAGLTNLKFD